MLIGVFVFVVVVIWLVSGDPNLREPCPQCKNSMHHLPGQDSGSTGEAKFGCTACDYKEFRGGWGSESSYEKPGRAYDVYGRPKD
jgi:transposase-like protein